MAVARIFFNMICSHDITMEDVPLKWQSQVQKLLDNASVSEDVSNVTVIEE